MTDSLPVPTDAWLDDAFAKFLGDPSSFLAHRPGSSPPVEHTSAVDSHRLVLAMMDASLEGEDLPDDLPLRAQRLQCGRAFFWEAVERVRDGDESAFEKRYFKHLLKELQRSLGKPVDKTKQTARFARGEDPAAWVRVGRGAEKLRDPLGTKMPWTLHRLTIEISGAP